MVEILNEGNPKCKHKYVIYGEDVDALAWWCDMDPCGRHERFGYSPGEKIKFPPGAFIRTPNPKYGGENTYAIKADSDGDARGVLPRNEWISKDSLDLRVQL